MRHVLIAGATGCAGGFVTQELKSRGYFVRALACTPAKAASLIVILTRCINRHTAELLSFFKSVATRDMVGPATGFHTLKKQYRNIGAQSWNS